MTRVAGLVGMGGAALFCAGLLTEYRYGLFPPGDGSPVYVLNQVQFLGAMSAIGAMLWEIRADRAGGDRRLARLCLTLFPLGWFALIAGGVVSLITGNADNLFYPLGGLTFMLFGLLSAIFVAVAGKWRGWTRFALLLEAVYYLLVMMVLPLVLTGSAEPSLLTESLWMATWFVLGLALTRQERRRRVPGALTRAG